MNNTHFPNVRSWSMVVISLLASWFGAPVAQAQTQWDFEYTMTNVLSSNADQYLESTTNAIKVNESIVSYWAPATPGDARVKLRFDFPEPIVQAHLVCEAVYAANFGWAWGETSCWVSKDNQNWVQLAFCPHPTGIDCGARYDSDLPSSLLGSTTLWIESRMHAQGWSIMSQFLRSNEWTSEVFKLQARYGCNSPSCNQALQLDGSSYLRVPDSSSLDLTGPFTIEAWIKPSTLPGALVEKWGDGFIEDRSYSLELRPDGQIQFGVARDDNQPDGAYHDFFSGSIAPGQWRHVASTYDGLVRHTYVDGVLVGTRLTSGSVHQGFTDLSIGAHLRNNNGLVINGFTGQMDEVRIWSAARSQEQIRSTINARITPQAAGGYASLVSCWNFEGNGSDAKGGNHGNPVGTPTYVLAPDLPVLFDCNANGVYDGQEIGANPTLDLNNNGVLDVCECGFESTCQTSPNSVGAGALMSYAGTPNLSGSLTLIASGCPTNVSGFFFYGTQPAMAPLGNGMRCVGGSLARLPVVNTGPSGVGARTLNYTQLPPNGPINAGSTQYFQFYYRDVLGGGAGFNLSNSLKVLFCP